MIELLYLIYLVSVSEARTAFFSLSESIRVWTSSAVEGDKNIELDFPLFPLHLLTESVLTGGI